jgi:hypothetical protein
LLVRATATTLNGRREKLCEPGILLQLQARTFQNGLGCEHQNTPKISSPCLDRPKLLFAASRVLSRNKPNPGRNVTI